MPYNFCEAGYNVRFLSWVPADVDISDNGIADYLAKRSSLISIKPIKKSSISDLVSGNLSLPSGIRIGLPPGHAT